MEFGVPSKRETKTEKYPDTPVITLLPYEGKGTSRKISFNSKAYEVLGLTEDDINNVAFSFNRSDYRDNAIINANEFESDAALTISKNGNLSNKKHFNEIRSRYNSPDTDLLELTIIDSGKVFADKTVFSLITLESLNKASETEIVEEETVVAEDTTIGHTLDVQETEEYA